MRLRLAWGVFVALTAAGLRFAPAQQAVSSIDQARLAQERANLRVNANGMALSSDDAASDDDFGEVAVLEAQPQARTFALSGDTAVYYTDNAALTPNRKIEDVYFVANAAFSWNPLLTPRLGAQVIAHGSTFHYDSTSVLDFSTVGAGVGLLWHPENFSEIGLFARYDFIEMFNRKSEEILSDHEFTIGAQKEFRFGQVHNLLTGVTFSAGISDPQTAQRDLAALFVDYRCQVTRSIGVELFYRFGGYFYNDTGRIDRNHILTASAHYRFLEGAYINAFFSFTDNRSEDSIFDYSAVSTGGGISATIQF